MIVTSHYDPLLNTIDDLIRKDMVWFTDKEEDGHTKLYSLTDFRGLGRISSFQKSYRNGVLGHYQTFTSNDYGKKNGNNQEKSRKGSHYRSRYHRKWYFSHMQTLYGLKVKIRPRYFGNENINTLEKLIKQVLDNEGLAIVVFDTDVSTWNESEKKKLSALRKKYSKINE